MRLFELAYCCRLYDQLSDSDVALNKLVEKTAPGVDLTIAAHRGVLFQWLKDWQCRIADAREGPCLELLEQWAHTWVPKLPLSDARLDEVSSADRNTGARAYRHLLSI